MSPILLRPIREQFEHSRVIRLLQSRLRRRYVVGVNLENEPEATGVRSGSDLVYPDLVLTSATGSRRLHGVVEVETAESVNDLEAMAQWGPFGRVRGAFYLYVPAGATDVAMRMCEIYAIAITEIWSFHAVGDQMRFTMTYRSARAASRAVAAARRMAKSSNRTSTGTTRGTGTAKRAVSKIPPNAKGTKRAGKTAKRTGKTARRTAKTAKRTGKTAKRTAKGTKRAVSARSNRPAAKRSVAKTVRTANRGTKKTVKGATRRASSGRKTSSRASTSSARSASKVRTRSPGARTTKTAASRRSRNKR